MSKLSSAAVNAAFMSCLFTDEEVKDESITAKAVVVEGIVHTVGLHPERLESKREEVKAMLSELPDQFFASKGGGWTFLNLGETKAGEHWTGLQQIMEQLCMLAIGLKLGEWCVPRSVWPALPGGVPYVVFKEA